MIRIELHEKGNISLDDLATIPFFLTFKTEQSVPVLIPKS